MRYLIKRLKEKFSRATFIMGDWSAPHQRYQEPIRGKGFRRLLIRNHIPVFLIDEYHTSKTCPLCGNLSVEAFKTVKNPRPYRRDKAPTIRCHGLLRCTMVSRNTMQCRHHTKDTEEYQVFLLRRANAEHILKQHYINLPAVYNGREGFPLNRKLKLNAYFNKQACDHYMIKRLKVKFPRAAFIMGDWSAPHQRYQDPIRGKGFRRLFIRNHIPVSLIDEYHTSKTCPLCGKYSVETFKSVKNPGPYRRDKTPRVICHGLLRCDGNNTRYKHYV